MTAAQNAPEPIAASHEEERTTVRRLSARASRADAARLTEEEIEAAELEAEEWARRVNRC